MPDPSRFEKIAEFLAERQVAVRESKTAAEKTPTAWDRLRPENPDRPGANWWTGLGGGALAAATEAGIGEHGLTDTIQRGMDRRNLRKNPLGRFNTPEFKSTIAGNEQAKFLHDLFNRQSGDTAGRQAIGRLLSRNYGTLNLNNTADVDRLYGEIERIVGSGDTEMSKRLSDLTTKGHSANPERARRIHDALDRHLARLKSNRKSNPAAVNQLTKFRTSLGVVDSAADLDGLKKSLQNLAASVKGGKKGGPPSYVFKDSTRHLLDVLGRTPVETARVRDAGRVRDLVTALGQFTGGRNIPSTLRRLGRGGRAAGIGTAVGAYALPSLIDLGKWVRGSGDGQSKSSWEK